MDPHLGRLVAVPVSTYFRDLPVFRLDHEALWTPPEHEGAEPVFNVNRLQDYIDEFLLDALESVLIVASSFLAEGGRQPAFVPSRPSPELLRTSQ